MSDEGKSKKRKGRSAKAAVAAASSRQRTLVDMFGGGSKASCSSQSQDVHGVIELSDSEPEILATQPPTPDGTQQSAISSAMSTLSLPTDDVVPPTTEVAPIPASPKRLFPIFEKRNMRTFAKPEDSREPAGTATPALDPQPVTGSTPKQPDAGCGSRSPSIQVQEPPSDQHVAGSSREAPIIIEPVSPEVKTLRPRPAKPVYSIFNRPVRAATVASKTTLLLPVPAPCTDNQPGDLVDLIPDIIPSRFPSRDKGKRKEAEAPQEPWSLPDALFESLKIDERLKFRAADRQQQNADYHDYDNTIPPTHRSIPAICRLLEAAEVDVPPEPSALNEQWAERWRPRLPEHVLGNEVNALYLRDWLQALRLQGESLRSTEPAAGRKSQTKKKRKGKHKKPDVVRHVKKRKRDGLEADFLAPDDWTESEDELVQLDLRSSDWDDIEFCREVNAKLNGGTQSTDASQGSVPSDDEFTVNTYKPARFGSRISNTILLSGPPGSGKTAAVYACAEELGWEVFEVYPGIGERSGAELNKLIGDVGKNHTVKVHQSPKKTNAKAAFFQTQGAQMEKRNSNSRRVCDSEDELDLRGLQGGEDEPVDVVGGSSPSLVLESAEPAVNQSVILIEEADILYHTDTNFWPALINIIKQCRRPVVLTCNDVSLIPRDDLPLQTTLEFRACPTPLAVSYLQAVCLAERKPLDRETISRTLEESSGDLRHALLQLQVGVEDTTSLAGEAQSIETAPVPQPSPDSSPLTWGENSCGQEPRSPSGEAAAVEARVLREVEKQHELYSFVDAWVSRASSTVPHGFFEDEPRPSADDELGYSVLYCDLETDHVPVSPFHTHDMQLTDELVCRVGTLAAMGASSPPDDPAAGRAAYLTRVGPLLRSFRAWTVPVADAALHLDYAPWLRYIVAVEEEQRAVLAQTAGPGGSQRRQTRNSQRTEASSWLALSAEQRGVLAATEFSQ